MTAVITGGTKGIGLGIAKELLKNGFTVVATSRNTNEEFKKLSNEYPDRLLFIPCDISSFPDIENLVLQVKNKFEKIDLLVNNAGVAPKERKDILELNPEEFDYVTDINMKGTFFVTQKFVDLLKAAGSARIVNISSMSAYTASVNRGEYCISKAGISMITKLYAARLAEYGISVIEIRPGIIETDMTVKVKEKYEKLIADGITPIKRMGKPSDIGRCVAAIAKGDFDFCTGTVIDCDGGFNVRCL
ncbi:MAG: 3-ketoacyl-ACP reductase [Clostridia bacterium]|nr:3-ketoacyl-ACP reductase [Clostridia bacterium]